MGILKKLLSGKKSPSDKKEKERCPGPDSPEETAPGEMADVAETPMSPVGDVDPELREKLSKAVTVKFRKMNKGEW